jgi:hypothetical protein
VIVHKLDPNPMLININKLKPYWFQDTTASKGLESTIERERDTTNTKIGFNIASLENVQGISTKLSFSVDGTEIQKSWLGIKIQDPLVQIKNLEDQIGIEICSIKSIPKICCQPRICVLELEFKI